MNSPENVEQPRNPAPAGLPAATGSAVSIGEELNWFFNDPYGPNCGPRTHQLVCLLRDAIEEARMPSKPVADYLRMQLSLYRYWCVAGPGGQSWRVEIGEQTRANYEAIRDYLERICGETADSDPYREHRQPNNPAQTRHE